MRLEVKESSIKKSIFDYLCIQFRRRGYFRVVQLGGIPNPNGYRKSLSTGISDIIGCLDGRFVAIEVKRPGGKKPTPEQTQFLEGIRSTGGFAIVARSLDDIIDACIKEFGVKDIRR